MKLSAGDRIGRYRVLTLLGEGGMGRVYRARDESLEREVAVKVIGREGPLDPKDAARSQREARTAAMLHHPNAVTIFDVGEHDGRPYIVMELVEGHSLRDRLGASNADKMRWLREVAEALNAAHVRGLIHRDVKPENIMITAGGSAKVLDFGIARPFDAPIDPSGATARASSAITAEGTMIGTPMYMAPEQLRCEALDGRVDQFAWGVLAYELFAGKTPWPTQSSVDTIAAILQSPAAPPSAHGAVPSGLEAVILRTLEKKPDDRFPSMNAVVEHLTALTAQPRSAAATLSAAVSQPTEPARPPRSNAPVKIGIAAVLLGVIGFALYARPRRLAPAPAERISAAAAPSASSWRAYLPSADRVKPEAYEAFVLGVSRAVAADESGANAAFVRAGELDPTFTAAYLRAALVSSTVVTDPAAQAFRIASQGRERLSVADKRLLDAFQPMFGGDSGYVAKVRAALDAFVATYPTHVEARIYRLKYIVAHDSLADVRREVAALQSVDPYLATPWALQAAAERRSGLAAEARASIDRCLAIAPTSTMCLRGRISLDDMTGECQAMELDARALMGIDPTDVGPDLLARALFAQTGDIATVRSSIALARDRSGEPAYVHGRVYDDLEMALAIGNFTAAAGFADKAALAAASSPIEYEHSFAWEASMLLTEEMGDVAHARVLAAEFLRIRKSWSSAADLYRSTVPLARTLAFEAGTLPLRDYEELRDAEERIWFSPNVVPNIRGMAWAMAEAAPARTEAEARAALARRPADAALMPIDGMLSSRPQLAPAFIGHLHLLVGAPKEALPLLTRGLRTCGALRNPIEYVRARLWLAQAREQTGDVAGACGEYRKIELQWHDAKPRSVTLDTARARIAALHCPA